MPSQINLYRMRDGKTPLAARYFNPVWESLDTRLGSLEGGLNQIALQLAELQALGLEGMQAVVLPLVEEARAALDALQEGLDDLEFPAALSDLLAYTHRANATTISYDGQGRVSTVTEIYDKGTKVVTLFYDGQGRVFAVRTDWDRLRLMEFMAYDGDGRVTGISVMESPL